jgi:hypothetical protein
MLLGQAHFALGEFQAVVATLGPTMRHMQSELKLGHFSLNQTSLTPCRQPPHHGSVSGKATHGGSGSEPSRSCGISWVRSDLTPPVSVAERPRRDCAERVPGLYDVLVHDKPRQAVGYWARKAVIGSTRIARRAGTAMAASATADRTAAMAT